MARGENHSTFYVVSCDWITLNSSPPKMLLDLTIKSNKLVNDYSSLNFLSFSAKKYSRIEELLASSYIFQQEIFLSLTSTSVYTSLQIFLM